MQMMDYAVFYHPSKMDIARWNEEGDSPRRHLKELLAKSDGGEWEPISHSLAVVNGDALTTLLARRLRDADEPAADFVIASLPVSDAGVVLAMKGGASA
jgi:hypothetical protein